MSSVNLILSVPSGWHSRTGVCGFQKAHMIYKIKSDGHLYRSEAPLSLRGGIMGICEIERCESGLSGLLDEVESECTRRGFSGILLCCGSEISNELTEPLAVFARRRGIKLYLPENAGAFPDSSCVLISTAISGGRLEERLKEASEKHGEIALDIERIRMDFTLPAGSDGKALSAQELKALMQRYEPRPFFSKELYTYYFTYRLGSETHFVIYDNAASISAKLSLGKQLGIADAFLLYPEIEDILPHIEL